MPKVILEEVLKKKKLSRYRFAKLLNRRYQNTVRYYNPEYDPKFSTLCEWAKALKISVKKLIRE